MSVSVKIINFFQLKLSINVLRPVDDFCFACLCMKILSQIIANIIFNLKCPFSHLCPSIFMKILILLLRFPYCGKARRQVPLLPQCLQKIPSHRFRNQYSIILTHCYFMPMFEIDIIMLSLVLGMVCGQTSPDSSTPKCRSSDNNKHMHVRYYHMQFLN